MFSKCGAPPAVLREDFRVKNPAEQRPTPTAPTAPAELPERLPRRLPRRGAGDGRGSTLFHAFRAAAFAKGKEKVGKVGKVDKASILKKDLARQPGRHQRNLEGT